MSVEALLADHEEVRFVQDEASGLRAIIAVHSTRLGPAAGGCRMRPYATVEAALHDVLRLSAAMTWKNALAGLPLGGGKSVIIADPACDKSDALLAVFGRAVEQMAGRYWTAEDVGMGLADVERLARHCSYVFGLESGPAATGDPSPFTARGGLAAIRTTAARRLGATSLVGLRVVVQGAGAVGTAICRQLGEAGARVVVADVDGDRARRAAELSGGETLAADAILTTSADLLAPCALGGVLSPETIPQLRCAAVAGVANNQLATPACEGMLHERGILFAPDFVASAGGMIHASADIFGQPFPDEAERIDAIGEMLTAIYEQAEDEAALPSVVAERLASERVAAGPSRTGATR
jgi:leucine dehydrogenase